MIPSFHAVFGLRHRDKTAKVIDYKGQVIRAQGITSFTHGYCRFAWLRHNNYIGQIPQKESAVSIFVCSRKFSRR